MTEASEEQLEVWQTLSPDEEKVLRALRRLEKMWPDSLLLHAGTGGINVMRYVNSQVPVRAGGDWDEGATLAHFDITASGGDPW